MQRIRMSLPYFKENGWEVEVITVDEQFSETNKDPLLLKNVPEDVIVHKVNAFSKKITGKFGLGSLALRSLYFYKKYVNALLREKKYDLIYFSTTEFAVTILGDYWKKKFNIPYVIDMQDPWHSTYYEDKPKNERPAKYWFSFRLNKYLEPIAMKNVDGLISVSKAYINDLQKRYPEIKTIPTSTITFGAFKPDFDLAKKSSYNFKLPYKTTGNVINLVYLGRGGYDMKEALMLLFSGFKKGLYTNPNQFKKLRFNFIGTSYAPKGQGKPTIRPIALALGIEEYVLEQTDRLPFYEGINALLNADGLLILGSNDPQYTASKIYPYILAERPLLALLHSDSSAYQILKTNTAAKVISLLSDENSIDSVYETFTNIINNQQVPTTDWDKFDHYSASNMTKLQCDLFNQIIN